MCGGGLVFPYHGIQDSRLGEQVFVALFVFDRLVGVLQSLVQVALVVDKIGCRVIPSEPRVLGKAAELLVQALLYDVVQIDRDFEGNRDLFPPQCNGRRVWLHIVKVIG